MSKTYCSCGRVGIIQDEIKLWNKCLEHFKQDEKAKMSIRILGTNILILGPSNSMNPTQRSKGFRNIQGGMFFNDDNQQIFTDHDVVLVSWL